MYTHEATYTISTASIKLALTNRVESFICSDGVLMGRKETEKVT